MDTRQTILLAVLGFGCSTGVVGGSQDTAPESEPADAGFPPSFVGAFHLDGVPDAVNLSIHGDGTFQGNFRSCDSVGTMSGVFRTDRNMIRIDSQDAGSGLQVSTTFDGLESVGGQFWLGGTDVPNPQKWLRGTVCVIDCMQNEPCDTSVVFDGGA